MNNNLKHILNVLRLEGKDYTDFKYLLEVIRESDFDLSKDEIIEFVENDYRIQLHTTPNSIAKLVSHLSLKNNPKNAIDICCGTGNILYYLQNEIDDLTGVEIFENVATLTSYFIPDLHIITADSFKYPFSRRYDLVVGNIPFGMRVELNGKRIPGEEAFLRKAHELLSENGRVIMLVPYSVLLGGTFQEFRKEFFFYLEEIIILPEGSIRNTQIKMAVLVIAKQKIDEYTITQLNNFDTLEEDYKSASAIIYSKKELSERWDIEYHLNKESSFYKELESFQTKELHNFAEIVKGKMVSREKLKQKGEYVYLKPKHIQKGRLKTESDVMYVSKEDISEKDYRYILQPGDIVISTIFNDLKMYVYQTGDEAAFASNNIAIIRSAKQDYISSYLQTDEGKRIFRIQAQNIRRGITIPYLSIKDLMSIKVPILPISDLNSLGDRSINRSTEAQLRDALYQLDEYRNQINGLEKENENISSLKAFIEDRFRKVEHQLEVLNNKLDSLLIYLEELKSDFEQIQKLPREDEEKLFKLCQKIDNKLDMVYYKNHHTIEGYIIEIKRWLDLWELLDTQSQKFLPIAELIFDELSKLEDADYAPFVVQYCRTLENEILKKLFEAYHSFGLIDINKNELLIDDLDHEKTGKFAKMVKVNKTTYTLGDMNFIMTLLQQGGRTLNNSRLLQHFRAFAISYFDERIVEADFLKNVNTITQDYRNKAAHPYSINIDLAKNCQNLLRISLNMFLESIRKNE